MIYNYQPRYLFEDQSRVYGSHVPSNDENEASMLVKSKEFTDVIVLLEKEWGDLYKVAYEAKGINVLHCPIEDYGIPSDEELHKLIPQILQLAKTPKHKILIHCQGGQGRTGLIAACALASLKKISADEAILNIRKCIPEAIETGHQRRCVERFVKDNS